MAKCTCIYQLDLYKVGVLMYWIGIGRCVAGTEQRTAYTVAPAPSSNSRDRSQGRQTKPSYIACIPLREQTINNMNHSYEIEEIYNNKVNR